MRRPRASTAAAALFAGALALAGCAGGSGGSDSGSDELGGAGGGVTTTLARTVTGAVDLRRLVVSNSPVGYAQLASPPFGSVDLARLLEEFSDAPMEDRVILEATRFKGGYTRGWLREDPRSFLGVFVFEFGSEDGARSARDQFAAQSVAKKGTVPFEVAGIDDATGESYTQQPEGEPTERVHVVSFVRGPRLYQIAGQFSDVNASTDETVAFAQIEDQIAA